MTQKILYDKYIIAFQFPYIPSSIHQRSISFILLLLLLLLFPYMQRTAFQLYLVGVIFLVQILFNQQSNGLSNSHTFNLMN